MASTIILKLPILSFKVFRSLEFLIDGEMKFSTPIMPKAGMEP
jgi:hypothetical protein